MTELIIVGDEAWLPEEYEARERRLARDRERSRRKRAANPEFYRAYQRAYYAKHRDKLRAYGREWMRAYRARKAA